MKKIIITALIITAVLSQIHIQSDAAYLQGPEEYRKPFSLDITYCTGTVLDDAGNGREHGLPAGHDYIHYSNIPAGTEVFTVFVFNPFSRYTDDIIFRYDIRR